MSRAIPTVLVVVGDCQLGRQSRYLRPSCCLDDSDFRRAERASLGTASGLVSAGLMNSEGFVLPG